MHVLVEVSLVDSLPLFIPTFFAYSLQSTSTDLNRSLIYFPK